MDHHTPALKKSLLEMERLMEVGRYMLHGGWGRVEGRRIHPRSSHVGLRWFRPNFKTYSMEGPGGIHHHNQSAQGDGGPRHNNSFSVMHGHYVVRQRRCPLVASASRTGQIR